MEAYPIRYIQRTSKHITGILHPLAEHGQQKHTVLWLEEEHRYQLLSKPDHPYAVLEDLTVHFVLNPIIKQISPGLEIEAYKYRTIIWEDKKYTSATKVFLSTPAYLIPVSQLTSTPCILLPLGFTIDDQDINKAAIYC